MIFLIILLTINVLITSFVLGYYASNTKNLNDFARTLYMGIELIVKSMFLIVAIIMYVII